MELTNQYRSDLLQTSKYEKKNGEKGHAKLMYTKFRN